MRKSYLKPETQVFQACCDGGILSFSLGYDEGNPPKIYSNRRQDFIVWEEEGENADDEDNDGQLGLN